ncbi:endo alpha-1,4 polygalactosaminidase [Amycolatopsis rhizosphaerae]|uniref:Endo alpha-1,4 polygalactosaminidase n=1 Tax=Amycolatopsis rhizosphaerae TaxID=2053003 RepID=A0A558DIM6_9PSEU|nr:endo alpha-1,4 polygalactosaminidase [Amycolatopsis rhizosphaerae]TVT60857.1 endo alpha-1,4 polygalactosaminidase [Amycolatopsis rhizosphaerae]
MSAPGPTSATAVSFPAGQAFDYQLGGAYEPPAQVRVVVRDSTAQASRGRYNICYVNGFQSQPGDRDLWLRERGDLVLRGPGGDPMVDPDWPDEFILDTSSEGKRQRLAEYAGQAIARCAASGFAAVEIDNLDSATRSGGRLTVDGNLALAAALARTAHAAGLAIGQKNAAELGDRGRREAGFDFAVSEECLVFDECGAYREAYGDRVVDIEYTDHLPGSADEVCARPDRPQATIIRDRKLVAIEEDGHYYRRC